MADRAFAENRFGLGPRGDEVESVGDPQGWATAQLARFEPRLAGIPTRTEVAEGLADYLDMRREARMDRRAAAPAAMPMATASATDMPRRQRDPELRMARRENREDYARLVAARVTIVR